MKSFALVAALATALAGGAASAATVTFGPDNWIYNESHHIPYTVVIDDNTAGKFTFTISTNGSVGFDTGDMLAFGFNASSLTGVSSGDFKFGSSNTGETITGIFSNTTSCGAGCNFNGATNTNFDWIVRMGSEGSANGLITDFVFTLDTNAALTDGLFTRAGIRAETVGSYPNGGNGSSKDLNTTPIWDDGVQPAPIPLPATVALLPLGVGALAMLRRRRKAA